MDVTVCGCVESRILYILCSDIFMTNLFFILILSNADLLLDIMYFQTKTH